MNPTTKKSFIEESSAVFQSVSLLRARVCELARTPQDEETLEALAKMDDAIAAAQRAVLLAFNVLQAGQEKESAP
jgi:hypothetical protein